MLIDSLEPRRLCAAGDPLESFGAYGTAAFAKPFRAVFPSVILPLADGKTLVAVDRQRSYNGLSITPVDFVRLNADGSRDNTFGDDSGVDTFFQSITTASVRPDGKIVAVGYAPSVARPGRFDYFVARFNADGTADSTFGAGGRSQLDPKLIANNPVHFPHVTTEGVVTLATFGGFVRKLEAPPALLRFKPDGTADKSFGTGGVVDLARGTRGYSLGTLDVTPAGEVVLLGNDFGPTYPIFLRKLRADGTDDPAFKPALEDKEVDQVTRLGDALFVSSIVPATATTSAKLRTAKLDLATGAPRTDFGTAGVRTDLPPATNIIAQPDDKLLFFSDGRSGTRVARLAADGTPDASFGQIEIGSAMATLDAARERLLIASRSEVLAVQIGGRAPGPVTISSAGIMTIAGTPAANRLRVSYTNGETAGTGTYLNAQRDGWSRVLPFAGVNGVVLEGGRGDDKLAFFAYDSNRLDPPATLVGAAGNDTIDARDYGAYSPTLDRAPVLVSSGAGSDTITLAGAYITVDAGSGDDSIRAAYENIDGNADPARTSTIHGGPGNDKIFTSGYLYRSTIAFELFGDAGDDTIKSGVTSDTITGGPGRDSLRSGGGVDTFFRDSDDVT